MYSSTLSSTDYVYANRIDWYRIAADLKDSGCSYNRQAKLLGKGWSTMQRWVAGAEPTHSVGAAWLMLHARQCGPELTRQRCDEGTPVI